MNKNRQQSFFFNRTSLGSNFRLVENAGQIKPSKAERWEQQRRLPVNVHNARVIAEDKALRESFVERARTKAPELGVVARKVSGNRFQIIGHGIDESTPRIVDSFQAVKDYAKSIGRNFVKMGAITANV